MSRRFADKVLSLFSKYQGDDKKEKEQIKLVLDCSRILYYDPYFMGEVYYYLIKQNEPSTTSDINSSSSPPTYYLFPSSRGVEILLGYYYHHLDLTYFSDNHEVTLVSVLTILLTEFAKVNFFIGIE